MKAYKLFRLLKDGTISPLFINKTQRLVEGVWIYSAMKPWRIVINV